jgi:hypothetical protein
MIINYLARRTWGQKALAIVVLGAGAFSWGDTLEGTKTEKDQGRMKYWWGWTSLEMQEHWERLADPKSEDYGSWYHSLKNIGSEWARLDPQRAYKALSFIVIVAMLLAFSLAFTVGVLL